MFFASRGSDISSAAALYVSFLSCFTLSVSSQWATETSDHFLQQVSERANSLINLMLFLCTFKIFVDPIDGLPSSICSSTCISHTPFAHSFCCSGEAACTLNHLSCLPESRHSWRSRRLRVFVDFQITDYFLNVSLCCVITYILCVYVICFSLGL